MSEVCDDKYSDTGKSFVARLLGIHSSKVHLSLKLQEKRGS